MAPASAWLAPTLLHRSSLVTVTDVRCSAPAGGHAHARDEEHVPGPTVVLSRAGVFRTHRGRSESLVEPGRALFLGGRRPYRVSHPVAGGDACTSFTFARDVLEDAGLSDDEQWAESDAPAPPIALILEALVRRHAERDAVAADERCLLLLREVAALSRSERSAGASRGLVERARLFLAASFTGRVRLADVARAAGCSPFHLARAFRADVGLPVHAHLTRLRLREAVVRLEGGCRDLAGLAHDLGFSSHAHMTDTFRAHLGVAPGRLREGLRAVEGAAIRKILEAVPVRRG